MKGMSAAVVTCLLTACAHESPAARQIPGLPRDVLKVADRMAMCQHFGGEINGDGSERDKEVFRTMTSLDCDTIERDEVALRGKYAGNSRVQAALDAAAHPQP